MATHYSISFVLFHKNVCFFFAKVVSNRIKNIEELSDFSPSFVWQPDGV